MKIQVMRLLKNYRLKASSLIESVVAIAIISICVFIATLVYVKLLESDYEIAFYKAKQKVSVLHLRTIEEQLFEDEVYDFGDYKIVKEIKDFSDRVKEVQFEVLTKTKSEKYSYLIKITEGEISF